MISTCEKYTTPSKVKILELIDHHHPAVSVVTQVTTALHCGILYYNIPTETLGRGVVSNKTALQRSLTVLCDFSEVKQLGSLPGIRFSDSTDLSMIN